VCRFASKAIPGGFDPRQPLQMSLFTQQPELLVATPDWRRAAHVPMLIDIEDYERAQNDQEWLSFCEKADAYVAAFGGTSIPAKEPG
jgi:hypothetical protein